MPDTTALPTIVIFVVCALYILALLIIAIKFLLQFLRFHRDNGDGEIHWRQSTGETPRNSFLHELQMNTMARRMEPPPSYSYAIDEAPPSYEDYEKNYSNTTSITNMTCQKSQKQPEVSSISAPAAVNISNRSTVNPDDTFVHM